jgi:hypothetical protein
MDHKQFMIPQYTPQEMAHLLVELGYDNATPEGYVDNDKVVSCTQAVKMAHAMAIFQALAKQLRTEWNIDAHHLSFALTGVTRHWERR